MNRLKKWLVETYLPAYARASMQEEQTRLRRKLEQEATKNRQLRAYADGLEHALAMLRDQRIEVRIGGGADGDYQGAV